ncbi:MAG TPA: hypothetical protein PKA63_07110 [Oligoflexia bacterium]|nr:hypothetical protein [Oligoflexia bacterium]HMP48419.1 hypothetical protein [Oligoflexia bacterium]
MAETDSISLLLVNVSRDPGIWDQCSDKIKVAILLREAKILLLEEDFSVLMINFMNQQEMDQIEPFVDGLKSHPRFKVLKVCINSDLFDKEIETRKNLERKGVYFVNSPAELNSILQNKYQYSSSSVSSKELLQDASIIEPVSSVSERPANIDEEFITDFQYLKEYSAKILAQIKIEEISRNPRLPKNKLAMRYLMLLQDEFLKDSPLDED